MTIHQKSKVNLDGGQTNKEELLDAFLVTAYDSNLTQLSLKAIQEILNVEGNPELMNRIKENIKQTQENIKAEVVIKTKNHLLTIIPLDDIQFSKDVVNQPFAPFLQDPIRDVRVLAFNAVTEIVVKTNDEKLLQETMNLLLPLLKYSESKDSYYANIKTLTEKSNSHQLIQDRITILTPLIKESDVPWELSQLIKIKGGTMNIQLVSDILASLIMAPFFKDLQRKNTLDNLIKEIVHLICCQNDPQSAKALIKSFIPLYEQQSLESRTRATMTSMEIIKVVGRNNTQFVKDIIAFFISLLDTPSCGEAFEHFRHLLSWDTQLCPYFLETIAPLLPNWNDFNLDFILREILLSDSQICSQFGRNIINVIVPLLKHSDNEVRYIVVQTMDFLFHKHLQTESEYITEFIKKDLLPLLQDPDDSIKSDALQVINRLFRVIPGSDIHFVRVLIETLLSFLSTSDKLLLEVALNNVVEITELSTTRDTQLIRDIIKILNPILQDTRDQRISKVASTTVQLANLDKNDNQLKKEVIDLFISLLQDPQKSIKELALEGIKSIICASQDPRLCKESISIFKSHIQDPEKDIRKKALTHLVDMVQTDSALIREVFDILAQALQDPENSVKKSAFDLLIKIAEINNGVDSQLPRDIFNLLSLYFQNFNRDAESTKSSFLNLGLFAKAVNDIPLIKDIINLVTPFSQGPDSNLRTPAALTVVEIVLTCIPKLVKPTDEIDTQFTHDTFETLASLLKVSDETTLRQVPLKIVEFVQKIDIQLSRKAIEALIHLLQSSPPSRLGFLLNVIRKIVQLGNIDKSDVEFFKWIVSFFNPLLESSDSTAWSKRKMALSEIPEIVNFCSDTQFVRDTIKSFIPYLKDLQSAPRESSSEGITKLCTNLDVQFVREIIDTSLAPLLKDSNALVRNGVSKTITEIIRIKTELIKEEVISQTLVPLLKDSDKDVRSSVLKNITELLKINDKNNDTKFVKEIIKNFVSCLEDSDNLIRQSATSNIIELLALNNDEQLAQDTINILSPSLQHSDSDIIQNALKISQSLFHRFLANPEVFQQFLTHSSKNLRDSVVSYLLACFQKYFNTFQELGQLSYLTLDMILKKFYDGHNSQDLRDTLQSYLEKSQEEQLRSFLVSEINRIENLKGSQIIELAIVAIGQEKISKNGSEREKLVELAKEVLNIQLKYLNEDGLIWINKNCEKLLSLSGETKVFYKKVYHKLLEDEEISSLEEQLLIKFINQGLTTSLTRDGEIIFEGKRYKLRGENIELALEKIAKTVIDQQQDILAIQYKQHEPIFKTSSLKGGMRQAAADLKEVKSIVDSRHSLQSEFWLLTRLKSLKFNSEIFLLEQRSAFGDHVVYHFSHQKLIRFYPGEAPVLQEIFGSYIYGEAYQGEVFELADKVGENLVENPNIKPSREGKLKSKQIYFQQELLKQGNEDRNSAVEEELAKKLDNNRAVLEAKLKSLNLKENEKLIIEDYYEGFISTFSSVYTSSQAIDSGKLSIDDGEDFFSPVNLFIQLTSLAPFGIGDILSNGLEAARSYIKSIPIANEAKFVKDFAIDAVELSDLVSKIALNIISNKEQRKKILEAKDDEEPNSVINKAKNLIMEKIEKLKSLAEKYTKMKNLFEKEVETSPAFRLGENDANKIIKEWIDLKGSQPDLRLKPEEKQKKFTKTIIGETGEVGEGNKITPMPTSPQEVKPSAKGKTACCEIF